ncbi:MAG: alpha/beta hydrolase [Candidatus Nanoarchaeia archaeon]|nr:alpha/beta hydrolase [Candidatus Nanoarchaeia archaeon]
MIKQIYFVNKNNNNLCGILKKINHSSPIIVLVHGFAGNKDENGLFSEAEAYFSSKNINTFRFDFEGVGESKGDFIYSNLESQIKDYKSALSFVSSKYTHDNIYVIGFSLGATVSILANDSRIKAYVLWSSALFPKNDMFLRYNTPEIKRELTEKGFIEKAGLKVGKNIINDLGRYSLDNIMF